ncbi:class 1 fructose-bisphosphatase [Stappia sp. GBMRC 2046]|uniref:Fructose-1,6-bisphosphatase class 1 n=1 Tax=Stappia sediminis TaxID=2692190 RepID=A0A7X3LRY4_9HYPH|nr:class 1 fructose-bisphosphatase [Stappia sediminis]MXN63978.1 class 1 fructose-bisphosphatase [Stappia sediminis]
MSGRTLEAFLDDYSEGGGAVGAHVAETIRLFAEAAVRMRLAINEGALGAAFSAVREAAHAHGDEQKELDVFADDLFLDAARRARVSYYASEELAHPVSVDQSSEIAIAIDPLDGSSNIDTNVSIGTIFSILPSKEDEASTFTQPGNCQLAAGFFIYGPQLALALTLGQGTSVFVYSARLEAFVEAYPKLAIPPDAREFAVNTSNYRHWDEAVRLYIDDCLKGAEGPREKDFNMRWIASLVADTYRILIRGGVFFYPGDGRKGYSAGRLRLVYEANPISMLIEQAGGKATDGTSRVLDKVPTGLHQRSPLAFGSVKEVDKIARYLADPSAIGNRHPLFGNRGLFRS